MKKIIYGKNKAKILDAYSREKSKFKEEEVSRLDNEVSVSDLYNLLNSFSLFGDGGLVVWYLDDKKYISDSHLELIKESRKNILLVLLSNLPKNSKILKVFDVLDKFDNEDPIKIFPLLEQISSKNKKGVVNLYYKMLREGNDPIYINSMIFYQYKNILHFFVQSETYNTLNPYVKRGLSKYVGMYDVLECANIIKEVFVTDKFLKSTNLNNEVLVLNLILKIVNNKLSA